MRTQRRIWWSAMGIFFVIGFIGSALGSNQIAPPIGELMFGFSFFSMIAWWFVGGFCSRIIGSMMVSSVRCHGCGLEVPAVTQWRVGSYTDHRARHFLWAKNPIDGSRLGHIDCPQCSCTIVL